MDFEGYQTFDLISNANIAYFFGVTQSSKNRVVGDARLFDISENIAWEQAYDQIMDQKYAKNKRNFSQNLQGHTWKGKSLPPIYLIPRERGGPSYKDVKLKFNKSDDVFFAPISKGYSMQDVSSFTLGPVVGEGLCVVNAAFSKVICIHHIEGGGKLDLKRKNFWARSKNPEREISIYERDGKEVLCVDNIEYDPLQWLDQNRDLWYEEHEKWRKSVALCSMGDFHWGDDSPTIGYIVEDRIVDFVTWKYEAYIRPAYELIPKTRVYKFLVYVWKKKKIPLGLVHPKAVLGQVEEPITTKYVKELFDSPYEMCCMPYVVAGVLLGVEI